MEPARLLVADPPWKFGDRLPGETRGAERQYKCLPVDKIMRFPLPALEKDALLLLWRVSSMQQEALDVARSWGFKVVSEIVWDKVTFASIDPAHLRKVPACGDHPRHEAPRRPRRAVHRAETCDACLQALVAAAEKPHFGMGRTVRASHETCLVAKRGRFVPDSKSVRTRFTAPVGEHSEKPEAFYQIAEQLVRTGRRVELFARKERLAPWDCYGDALARAAPVEGE